MLCLSFRMWHYIIFIQKLLLAHFLFLYVKIVHISQYLFVFIYYILINQFIKRQSQRFARIAKAILGDVTLHNSSFLLIKKEFVILSFQRHITNSLSLTYKFIT